MFEINSLLASRHLKTSTTVLTKPGTFGEQNLKIAGAKFFGDAMVDLTKSFNI
jgi:hypothetical protein